MSTISIFAVVGWSLLQQFSKQMSVANEQGAEAFRVTNRAQHSARHSSLSCTMALPSIVEFCDQS